MTLVKDKLFTIDQLFNAGIISAKAHFYIDVTDKVQSLILAGKLSKGKAIKEVAKSLNITPRTIYNAINIVSDL